MYAHGNYGPPSSRDAQSQSQEPQNHKTMMEWEQRHHGNLQDNEVNAAAFSDSNTGVDRGTCCSLICSHSLWLEIWAGKIRLNSLYLGDPEKRKKGIQSSHMYIWCSLIHCILVLELHGAVPFHGDNLQNKIKHLYLCRNSRFSAYKVRWSHSNLGTLRA